MAKSSDQQPETDKTAGPEDVKPEPDKPATAAAPDIDKPKTVTVHCQIPNGFVMSWGAHTAEPMKRTLNHGANAGVPAVEWEAWLLESEAFPAVHSGHIFATEE